MAVPLILRQEESWKHLLYEDIIQLCQTNKFFNTICQRNNTWIYLLKRDFDRDYSGDDARREYLSYREILEHFSQFYPVITKKALYLIHDLVPKIYWDLLDGDMIDTQETRFDNVLRTVFLPNSLPINLPFYQNIVNVADSNADYPNFDLMIQNINVDPDNYYLLRSSSERPNLVYVMKIPTMAPYDYELYRLLIRHSDIDSEDPELETFVDKSSSSLIFNTVKKYKLL